jgi:hypothetical protein
VNLIDLDIISFGLNSSWIRYHRWFKNTGTANIICPIMSAKIRIYVNVAYSKSIILQRQEKSIIARFEAAI